VSDYNNYWHSQQAVYASSKDGFISHLTYLVQLPYLGKSQNTKNDKFRCKQHIVLCMNSVVLNAEASSAVIRSLGVGATGRTFSPHGPLHYPIFLPTLLPFPLLHFPRLHPSLWPLPSTFSPICGKFWIYILQILAGEFWRVLNTKVASVIHLHSGLLCHVTLCNSSSKPDSCAQGWVCSMPYIA